MSAVTSLPLIWKDALEDARTRSSPKPTQTFFYYGRDARTLQPRNKIRPTTVIANGPADYVQSDAPRTNASTRPSSPLNTE